MTPHNGSDKGPAVSAPNAVWTRISVWEICIVLISQMKAKKLGHVCLGQGSVVASGMAPVYPTAYVDSTGLRPHTSGTGMLAPS